MVRETLQQIEALIQAARGAEARRALSALVNGRQIRRAELAQVASLARRAGLAMLSIRCLYPVVRGSKKSPPDASDEEKSMEWSRRVECEASKSQSVRQMSASQTSNNAGDL